MSVLSVSCLSKVFTSGWRPFSPQKTYMAVDNVSFDVGPGEIVGFLGANGAGKTTTIQMLLGTLTPTSGLISYFGYNFKDHRHEALRKIGYSSGYERLPARLTIMENLDIVGRIYGLSVLQRAAQIEKLLTAFGMWEKRNHQTGTLSAGQATRVMLAKAFIADPEIVLLDEPTASLDPEIAHEVRAFILAQRKERNISILITSHNMDEVAELCDRVLVLKNGSIIANSTPHELAQSISQISLQLTITGGFERLLEHLRKTKHVFTDEACVVSIKLDEHAIAQFLTDLGTLAVSYSHISINKPTLEDYFLSITK